MKIKSSPQCLYCDEIDDINHLFFHCPNVQHLWFLFFEMRKQIECRHVDFPYYPNVYAILFGVNRMNDENDVLNFCILHIIYYIYKQQLFNENTMSLREIRNDMRYELDIEQKDMCKWR